MSNRVELIAGQDIDAYVDGALSPLRRRAVELRLTEDSELLARAVWMLRTNTDLQRLRSRLYEDVELREALDWLDFERGDCNRTLQARM